MFIDSRAWRRRRRWRLSCRPPCRVCAMTVNRTPIWIKLRSARLYFLCAIRTQFAHRKWRVTAVRAFRCVVLFILWCAKLALPRQSWYTYRVKRSLHLLSQHKLLCTLFLLCASLSAGFYWFVNEFYEISSKICFWQILTAHTKIDGRCFG